jgi:hypothetical protein
VFEGKRESPSLNFIMLTNVTKALGKLREKWLLPLNQKLVNSLVRARVLVPE